MADGINILIPLFAAKSLRWSCGLLIACRCQESEAGCGKDWHCGGKSKKHHR